MSNYRLLMAGCSALVLLAHAQIARADETTPPDTVDEIVVKARDKAGLLEKQPNNTVFGIDKPLLETPRSASFVSDVTLQRYGIETIDGLTAVSPGTYTASFYGVPGALNIRGTLAENYFRGFKRVENRGTYSTPIGGAARIEILRGPPTPVYGAGKVGARQLHPEVRARRRPLPGRARGRGHRHLRQLQQETGHGPVRRARHARTRRGRRLCLWRGRGQPQLLPGHLSASPDAGALGRLRPGQRLDHGVRRHVLPL